MSRNSSAESEGGVKSSLKWTRYLDSGVCLKMSKQTENLFFFNNEKQAMQFLWTSSKTLKRCFSIYHRLVFGDSSSLEKMVCSPQTLQKNIVYSVAIKVNFQFEKI